MRLSSQLYAPAALLRGENSQYPLDRRLGGPHSRSGQFTAKINLFSLARIENRSVYKQQIWFAERQGELRREQYWTECSRAQIWSVLYIFMKYILLITRDRFSLVVFFSLHHPVVLWKFFDYDIVFSVFWNVGNLVVKETFVLHKFSSMWQWNVMESCASVWCLFAPVLSLCLSYSRFWIA
jgi:hypothetical protein